MIRCVFVKGGGGVVAVLTDPTDIGDEDTENRVEAGISIGSRVPFADEPVFLDPKTSNVVSVAKFGSELLQLWQTPF